MDTRILEVSESLYVTQELDNAVASETPVFIVYAKTDEPPQNRLVSPSEIWEAKDSSLILSAFDHGREEPRSFRLDKIERVYDAPLDTDYIAIEKRGD